MKQDSSGKIVMNEKKHAYIYSLHTPTVLSVHHFEEMLFTQTLKSKMERFHTLCILAPLVFTPALVKHTRVGSNWVNGVSMIFSRKPNPVQHQTIFMNDIIIDEITCHKHLGLHAPGPNT